MILRSMRGEKCVNQAALASPLHRFLLLMEICAGFFQCIGEVHLPADAGIYQAQTAENHANGFIRANYDHRSVTTLIALQQRPGVLQVIGQEQAATG